MNSKTYAIYEETGTGTQYRMYPTLIWFDKNTEFAVGEEKITTIRIKSLIKFLKYVEKRMLEEPLRGSIDITERNDFFILSHIKHQLKYDKYNYQLSFDEVETVDSGEVV